MKQEAFDKNAVSSYLNSLKRYPQLPHPQVVELFQKIEESNDNSREKDGARKKLIESNLRLVVSIAKQYKNHNIPIEDLIQEGNIGLMKSIERFDWKRGFRFSTYATWWIKQAIGQHVLKRKRIIRLPAHAASVQRKLIQAIAEYRELNHADPTTDELVELTGASETVIRATMHSGLGTISLQQAIGNDPDGDTIEDKVVDDRPGCDPFENVAEMQLLDITHRVFAELSPKEIAILRLRFGLVDDIKENDDNYRVTAQELNMIKSGHGLTD